MSLTTTRRVIAITPTSIRPPHPNANTIYHHHLNEALAPTTFLARSQLNVPPRPARSSSRSITLTTNQRKLS